MCNSDTVKQSVTYLFNSGNVFTCQSIILNALPYWSSHYAELFLPAVSRVRYCACAQQHLRSVYCQLPSQTHCNACLASSSGWPCLLVFGPIETKKTNTKEVVLVNRQMVNRLNLKASVCVLLF